ncbi:hypothetical protein WJX73_008125 [Symbiochloris irregularis]|uniref:Uncharacterized protein n=1 Tax=Symbiochloris irregularis TaxID=706552 RepID=A0AAW1PVD5_9CHLO
MPSKERVVQTMRPLYGGLSAQQRLCDERGATILAPWELGRYGILKDPCRVRPGRVRPGQVATEVTRLQNLTSPSRQRTKRGKPPQALPTLEVHTPLPGHPALLIRQAALVAL